MVLHEMNNPQQTPSAPATPKIPEAPKILEIIAHNLRTYLGSSQPKEFRIRRIEVNYNPEMQLSVVGSYGSAIMATGHGPTLDIAVASFHEQALYEASRREGIRPTPKPSKEEVVRQKLGISLKDLFG